MADHEPPETVESPSTQEPAEPSNADAAAPAADVPALPDRIRVHALAKLLGIKSKQVLAALEAAGVHARSPHSSIGKDVAESVRDTLAGAADQPAAEPAQPDEAVTNQDAPAQLTVFDEPAAPVPDEPAAPVQDEPVVDEPVSVESVSTESSSVEPESVEPLPTPPVSTQDRAAEAVSGEPDVVAASYSAPEQLFTSAPESVADAVPTAFDSAVAAPLFLQPDADAARDRRRRRTPAKSEAEPATESAPEADETGSTSDQAAADTSKDADEQEESTDATPETQAETSTPRRRRRGRRGRGRGRGEQSGADAEQDADSDTDADADSSDDATDESADSAEQDAEQDAAEQSDDAESADTDDSDQDGDDGDESASPNRRRRRRRRRKTGESGADASSEDDPPNTVVHEREPRNKARAKDEVQGITGSTRLEAKRQRRRDGRDAGRRRPPILTESEFLARREAVDRVMVVREKKFPDHPLTTQVAVLEDNVLVEHFVTSTSSGSMVGNIYLGRVQNVLPSMEAAFVDIGRGRNGVLYAGEVNWEAAGLGGKERKIEQALKPGDQVLVQVSKDPVGHKGARLTTQISLAGRFLVYVPGGSSTGISRKLPDTERKRLKDILRDIVPDEAGVIIRTASEGVSAEELARDVERLQSQWRAIDTEASAAGGKGNPRTLYEEPDLLVKVIRDLFNEDFSKIVIEGERAWKTVESYIGTVAPDLLPRVHRHDGNGGPDVFEVHRIDEQLAKALERKVWLPSGGTLVIDRTEAMTVVDVNTGKFTGAGGNLEETVTRNNLEAAEEIVRQMRLRDIGGMIVVDFIDMVLESNRDLVLRRLTEALGRDRTRHQVSEVTSLGLVQMTRKRLGTGLVEAFSTPCEHCHGRGIIVSAYPVDVGGGGGGDDAQRGGGRPEATPRRRRGRDRSTPDSTDTPQTHAAPEIDPSVRRAHPVALAMAAHQHDHTGNKEHEGTTEAVASKQPDKQSEPNSEPKQPEPKQPEAKQPDAKQPESSDTASEPVAEELTAATPADIPATVEQGEPEPDDEAPAEPDVHAPAAAEVAAEQTPEATDNGEAPPSAPDEQPRRPWQRRKVSRAASAPAGGSNQGKVFVIPTPTEPPPVVETAAEPVSTSPAPSVPPRQPRRRRAAGRPAGPPVDEPGQTDTAVASASDVNGSQPV